ncbi:DNA mismatch repair protein MutS, variant 3 [Aphanomyces invadans]|nr:DNA mismatch repair protein MutS, variant 2 [Aphanomyces invadans]XP_008877285.1 DNA mismatch repair protein MutS, variant 3 [Aphanomyces invadans]ETV94080.1 DNA mismatch repair protein MutS, variant 2 [Aphanomyces invadans]ETV94081.1 DNA mismatch repair protein MutS, variant 3 [Aphanomyces invadans]|eukprot:XP_008877284.1 DNA mismatch repair protein MutS, variant 2 [Aphanomyces invadans]
MLLFQVGDFYELFADDARRASHLLNLTLTRKTKPKVGKSPDALDVMCGFPLSSLHTYVEKLVRHHGEKVAICNQVESAFAAKQRGGVGMNSLVQRQVVRVVTPGSLTEDSMLMPTQNNYLAALSRPHESTTCQIAYTDISTGEFHVLHVHVDDVDSELCRLQPSELLVPSLPNGSDTAWWLQRIQNAKAAYSCAVTIRPPPNNAADNAWASAMIRDFLAYTHVASGVVVAPSTDASDSSSVVSKPAMSSARMAATSVVESNAKQEVDRMRFDVSVWRSLELTKSIHGQRKHTLLDAIDATKTAGGARLLSQHLAAPLLDVASINERLDAVEALVNASHVLQKLRGLLQDCGDVERCLQRLSIGGTTGTPKDLKRISDTAVECQNILPLLNSMTSPLLKTCRHALQQPQVVTLANELKEALMDDVVQLHHKDGFIRPGYSEELDGWRALCNEEHAISALQATYQRNTANAKLRIVRKKLQLGWCVEVPQATPVHDASFQLIQTTTKALRYRTLALDQLNLDLHHANDQRMAVEQALLDKFTASAVALAAPLHEMASALSVLDVMSSHAQMALDHALVRPTLTTDATLAIVEGRHLIVESVHERTCRSFVPNSVHLSPPAQSAWVITGPNMGGKSTFLRQTAHLVVLAQMGSFVPATSATIGVVDRLFSRVGASDDLASDRSTFMVEMQETATILHQATSRSLVLMDEVGRGTSVQDGLAIAQAVVEELLDRRARLLFATHFTELDKAIARDAPVAYHHMQVVASGGSLVFSHRVVPGVASASYGIEVAALAGCPRHVVERAKALVEARASQPPGNDLA